MPHWRSYVSADNPHLHHWDIEQHSPVVVTIEKYGKQDVRTDDNESKAMLFLHFKGGKKPFGVNTTNAHIIAAMHG